MGQLKTCQQLPQGDAGRRRERVRLFEKMIENFPNLAKETDIRDQKAQSLKQDESKRPTQRHIVIKMPKFKNKERILKAAREKLLPIKELP